MNVKTRLGWVRLYQQLGDAGKVCRRCGISRPTLRKWWRRYQRSGVAGLKDESRRPQHLARQKVFAEQEALILDLRRSRHLGIKQLRSELLRQHGLALSLDTLHRVLVRHSEQHLKRPKLKRKGEKRYSRPVPGDRVQLDVCKIVPGVYQYTAIDDCSRYRVLGVYSRRTATNTLDFLERLIEEMPFPIQRLQTDRGLEFFAETVQRRLMDWAIKFRPIKPRSPHLNGKVERSQRADLEEFWPTVDPRSRDVAERLAEWQHFWNWERPHSALTGKAPIDRVCELLALIPSYEDVENTYDVARERIRLANYAVDSTLARVK
jgi:transposase InsO family protein